MKAHLWGKKGMREKVQDTELAWILGKQEDKDEEENGQEGR